MPTAIHMSIVTDGLISTNISKKDNKRGWTKHKPGPSAESSGLTMGLYATGCAYPYLNAIDTLIRDLP